MTTKVRHNLLSLIHKLEERNKRRYQPTYIGKSIGRSRQAVDHMLMGEQDDDSFIKFGVMGRLIDFFRDEGLEVTPGDFFCISTDPTKE